MLVEPPPGARGAHGMRAVAKARETGPSTNVRAGTIPGES